MRRSTFVIGMLGLSLGLGGCAAMRGMSAKHAYLEQETEKHVYEKPLKEVWPQARQLLFEKGFEVKDTDASNAETEWKEESDGKRRERYLLSGIEVSDTTCKVQFMHAEEQKSGGKWEQLDSERDLGLEFDLIAKVEPDVHSKIEAEGDLRAEKAKKGD